MLTAPVLGAVLAAVLLGALAQSVSGLGFGLVAGPLLVAAVGPDEGVRLVVALSAVLNAVLAVRLRADVAGRSALLLLLPAVAATPVLAALQRGLPDRAAAAAAGGAVLLGAGLLWRGGRWPAARGGAGRTGAAVVSAAMNVVSGVGGPPVALWATNASWAPSVARATLQAYFLGLNLVALAALGGPAVPLDLLLASAVALAGGALLGVRLAARTSPALAQRLTLLLAAAGGTAVLLRALLP